MADDKNKDLDPEEEKKDSFDEDDDFGLPDLEFDELDDDDFEDEFDNPEFDLEEETEEFSEEVEAEQDEAFTVEDDFNEEEVLEDLEETDEVGFEEDTLEDDDIDISDEELQKELEDLEAEEMNFDEDESDDSFYEEESFEEFADDNSLDSVFGTDDTVESTTGGFTPTASGAKDNVSAKQKAANQYASASYGDSGADKGNFTRIVIFGTIIILVIASTLWFAYDGGGDNEKEIAKTEAVKKPAPKKAEPEPVKEEPKPEVKPQPKPAKTTPGVVNQLTQRSGKAYIVIGSFVDGDLAMDYANELAADGKSPYLIPPFNNGLYYRVAIAEYSTFSEASQGAANYKSDYGQDIWTLRY